jgi:hypothetical protein
VSGSCRGAQGSSQARGGDRISQASMLYAGAYQHIITRTPTHTHPSRFLSWMSPRQPSTPVLAGGSVPSPRKLRATSDVKPASAASGAASASPPPPLGGTCSASPAFDDFAVMNPSRNGRAVPSWWRTLPLKDCSRPSGSGLLSCQSGAWRHRTLMGTSCYRGLNEAQKHNQRGVRALCHAEAAGCPSRHLSELMQ